MRRTERLLLVVYAMKLFHINSVFVSQTLEHGGFCELLAGAKLLHDASFFILSLEFLKGAFDILTLFYGNYNHFGLSYIIIF